MLILNIFFEWHLDYNLAFLYFFVSIVLNYVYLNSRHLNKNVFNSIKPIDWVRWTLYCKYNKPKDEVTWK